MDMKITLTDGTYLQEKQVKVLPNAPQVAALDVSILS
jgi:hypothetical protein